MIRSLYLRVVLTFLAAVVLGVVIAFFVSGYLFRDSFATQLQRNLLESAKDFAATVEQTQDVRSADLQNLHWINNYYLTLYDPAKNKITYGTRQNQPDIENSVIDQVLGGRIVTQEGDPREQFVGYPFSLKGGSYALFVQVVDRREMDNFRTIALTILTITLLMGSVFVIIAARYLVKPLKSMTKATRRISKGDFNISFGSMQRSDEVGELARSFSQMAGELKQMEQMRQDFVSSVSHEIQSPLTSIAGFSKLMRVQDMEKEERDQCLEIIQKEAERLSRLSDNLLKLASLDSEHHPFVPKSYRLDEQLRRIIVSIEPIWSAKELKLQLTLPPAMVTADEDQLSQVWINLLHNAIKFTPLHGVIQVKAELLTDSVQVTVRDSGLGIAESDLPHIFERFYKTDRSREREAGGSGLGLAIVHKIVELHSGSIEVRSTIGQGTAFRVALPAPAVRKQPPAAAEQPKIKENTRISASL
ncbi:HAMP domain-containing sensor histidine kinase [Paenibacillus thalictri]|uniref:Heme sensor protein HssS n=1 Tax=Paenibacillus thalictri TaxID=2527873 RepID=A0A4Q9DP71_9BACL|nr:HAMP domain-containing sensor histidine kinase [Paenibacillus thalictri]TBL77871.1 sensor histidine kinase [Paenibacillus thalictri]